LFAEKRTIDAFRGRFVFFSKGQFLAGIGGSILPVATKFESSTQPFIINRIQL
jgi:hypothetical protein